MGAMFVEFYECTKCHTKFPTELLAQSHKCSAVVEQRADNIARDETVRDCNTCGDISCCQYHSGTNGCCSQWKRTASPVA